MQGFIKSLGYSGYGFVQPFDNSSKAFFHANDVDRDFDLLVRGDALEFDVVQAERGPECRNIHVLTPLRETTVGTGTIKRLDRGHGYLESEGKEVFFHFRPSFRVTVADIGRSVNFKSVETGYGLQAVSIWFTDVPGWKVGDHRYGTLAKIKNGFGFISHGCGEIFYHQGQLPYRVTEADVGRPVEYDVGTNDRGLVALNICFTDEQGMPRRHTYNPPDTSTIESSMH
jgi:cold shock CspA family protein